jgi:hypothetical protein
MIRNSGMMKTLLLAIIIALLALPASSSAKDAWYDGFYVGAGVGGGYLSGQLKTLGLMPPDGDNGGSLGAGFPPEGIAGQYPSFPAQNPDAKFNDMALAYKFFGGYRVMDYFAVEGGYMKFDTPGESYCFLDPITGECDADRFVTPPEVIAPGPGTSVVSNTSWHVTLPLDGWTAYAVGLYPFANDKFEAFAKVGAVFWSMNGVGQERIIGALIPADPTTVPKGNKTQWISSDKDHGTDIAGGLGFNFNSDAGVTIRTEFEYFDIETMNSAWFLSMSAIYNF